MVFSIAESLMVLDGLYGMISEIILQLEDKALQSLLACRILRELKLIINSWKKEPVVKSDLVHYNGYLINNLKLIEQMEDI